MRIKEKIKRLGYFWLPSKSDRKVPGTLSISDGGNIELEVTGHFHENLDEVFSTLFDNDSADLKRIVGLVEQDRRVTLDDCYYKEPFNFFGGPSKFLIHVGRVFTGVAYNEGDIPLFNTLTFSVEGIDEWVGISGIEVTPQFEEGTATISYQLPADVPLNLANGIQLLITFKWALPGFPIIKEAGISQKTYFKLVSKEARELSDFISVAHKITTFLCFAIDQTISLDGMWATSDNRRETIWDGTTELIPINIYYSSQSYSKEDPRIYQDYLLFRFEQIQNDAERMINNWIKAYEKINPTFDLYFSTQIGQPYLTVKFLTLVQGLEAYHHREKNLAAYRQRKKGDRELYLREKIEDVIEPFKEVIGDEDKRGKLIDEIVNTRNYLTHYNPEKESKAAKDEDLLPLCLKMELLFQLHFLRLIGFNREEIDSIVANCEQLQWKLNQQL